MNEKSASDLRFEIAFVCLMFFLLSPDIKCWRSAISDSLGIQPSLFYNSKVFRRKRTLRCYYLECAFASHASYIVESYQCELCMHVKFAGLL